MAWIGHALQDCGGPDPALDANPMRNAREMTRSVEKRRETKGNDGSAGRARTTLDEPLDTPSVRRRPVYSSAPVDGLKRSILAHQISIADWLSVAFRVLLSSSSPSPCSPPQVSQRWSSLLKPRQKTGQDCPLRGRVAVEGRKKRRVCLCIFRSALRCKTKSDASRPPAPTAAVHTARHKPYPATPGMPDKTRTR